MTIPTPKHAMIVTSRAFNDRFSEAGAFIEAELVKIRRKWNYPIIRLDRTQRALIHHLEAAELDYNSLNAGRDPAIELVILFSCKGEDMEDKVLSHLRMGGWYIHHAEYEAKDNADYITMLNTEVDML